MNIDYPIKSFDKLMKMLAKRVAMEFDKNYYAKLLVAIEEKNTKLVSDLVDICKKRRMLNEMHARYLNKYLTCDDAILSSEEQLKRLSELDNMRRSSPILYNN